MIIHGRLQWSLAAGTLIFTLAAIAFSLTGGDGSADATTTTASTVIIATTSTSTTLVPKIYTVLSGESIFRISEKFGIKMQDIIDLNKIDNPDKIEAGDQILLPQVPVTQGATGVTVAPTSLAVAPSTP